MKLYLTGLQLLITIPTLFVFTYFNRLVTSFNPTLNNKHKYNLSVIRPEYLGTGVNYPWMWVSPNESTAKRSTEKKR